MTRHYKNAISLIDLLYVCSDDFKNDVKLIRKIYGIKLNRHGVVPIKRFLDFDRNLISDRKLSRRYEADVLKLAKDHNIDDYLEDVETLVESGLTPYSIVPLDMEHYFNRTKNISKPESIPLHNELSIPGHGFRIAFTIRKPIKKKDLQIWLENYSDYIITLSNDSFKYVRSSLVQINNIERILRIIHLRDVKHKHYSEIADKLCDESPDDPDVQDGKVNEESVKQTYLRYKKRYKKVTPQ